MNRNEWIAYLINQARQEQAALDRTLSTLDALMRAQDLERMAADWAFRQPARLPSPLLRVDSVSVH